MALVHLHAGTMSLILRTRPWLRSLFSLLISAFILVVLFRRHDVSSLFTPIILMTWFDLTRFLILLSTTIGAAVFKIRSLFAAFTPCPGFLITFRTLMISAALNSLLPGRLGDIHRITLLRKMPQSGPRPIFVLLLERYFDIGIIFFLLAITSLLNQGRFAFLITLTSLCLVLIQSLILLNIYHWSKPNRIIAPLTKLVQTWTAHPKSSLITFFWGTLSWGLNMVLLSFALHLTLPTIPLGALLAAGALGIAAGLSPVGFNGLGVREAVLIFCYPNWPPGGIIQGCLIFFLFSTIPIIIIGATLIPLNRASIDDCSTQD